MSNITNYLLDKDYSYEKTKELAIQSSPEVVSYPLTQFDIKPGKRIFLQGQEVPVTESAYWSFIKNVLDVKPDFVEHFQKVVGEKEENKMLLKLKHGLSQLGKVSVQVIWSKRNREITSFTKSKRKLLNNEGVIDIFEQVLNEYGSQLTLREFSIGNDGRMLITLNSNSQKGYDSNEIYRGGISFKNDFVHGSGIFHNAFREICTNGMFGYSSLPLTLGAGTDGLEKFFKKLEELSKGDWMYDNFEALMHRAMDNDASVSEYDRIRNVIKNNTNKMAQQEIDEFFDFRDVTGYLAKRGIEYTRLNDRQKSNCPSGMKLWDLINKTTDFGSHDYGYQAKYDYIQANAGVLFSKSNIDANGFVYLKA